MSSLEERADEAIGDLQDYRRHLLDKIDEEDDEVHLAYLSGQRAGVNNAIEMIRGLVSESDTLCEGGDDAA